MDKLSRIVRLACQAALIVFAATSFAPVGAEAAPEPPGLGAGEVIYRQGVLPSGKPLEALRQGGARMDGIDAACANCHRRSGLGSKEGLISIPPVTGRYLFHQPAPSPEALDLPYVESIRPDRQPYTDATLARAIRDGIGVDGKPLNYLMPHFALDDADMSALIAYLRSMDRRTLPGVEGDVLHFATIITPDADPVKRKGMLAVLNQFFADKNTFPLGATPPLRSSRKQRFMVNRLWKLHVWQLSGPASTWESQLDKYFAEEPVLAVISGLGGGNWAPVHAFCEHAAVPCLFPNVEAPPPGADHDFYSLYFSRGVELEAGLIADRMFDPSQGRAPAVVEQIYRAGDSGAAGAAALAEVLKQRGIVVKSRVLPAGKPGRGVSHAVRLASKADALVLWLRARDIAALGRMPRAIHAAYLSGLMGGLEDAPLPRDWRVRTRLSYPFALRNERRVNVDFALGWMAIRHLPLVAEQVQADTFLSCSLLAEALHHMYGTFVPEYLVERYEDMMDRRLITGYYPRLTLAPGERFASRGGYVVHFSGPKGMELTPDSGWTVP